METRDCCEGLGCSCFVYVVNVLGVSLGEVPTFFPFVSLSLSVMKYVF